MLNELDKMCNVAIEHSRRDKLEHLFELVADMEHRVKILDHNLSALKIDRSDLYIR